MARRMLIDAAHPEETRVVVLSGNRLDEFDFESSTKKQVKGNIYLAKVTRVEPSLQAAFVDYGGNRHGFLAFNEIHPDYYRIPVGDRETSGAALPSFGGAVEIAENGGDDDVVGNGHDGSVEAGDAAADGVEAAGQADEPRSEPPPAEEAPALVAEAAPDPAAPAETDAGQLAEHPAVETHDDSPVESHGEPNGEAHYSALSTSEMTVVGTDYFESGSQKDDGTAEGESIETFGGDEMEDGESDHHRSRPLRNYKIQEVIKRRQIMLVQVVKEERGNKGAALTTYLSLAGRYCVLMPNTGRGGGVSRKITSISDRRRLKEILEDLDIPEGMGVIVRTAGAERSKAEIKRDYEYLLRLWNEIRELTLSSSAPALIYEEGNLIKRSIRDLYTRDIDEVQVEGEEGYRTAKDFMRMLMPSHAKRVQPYRDPQIGLFHRAQVESQIDAIHSPVAQLRSGGYVVINQTEALVAIDVNSGRATRERNIEETALRTNLEAAEELARQLRLRDLAGLIVIDFIDMEEHRNNGAVERRLKEALKNDRARIQVGRISPFGLLEMSRQRLRPSLTEASTLPCPHCGATGFIRSTESTALYVLRSIEEEGIRQRSAEICIYVPTTVALYLLNQKRDSLAQIETRYGVRVIVARDDALIPPNFRLERLRSYAAGEAPPLPRSIQAPVIVDDDEDEDEDVAEDVVEEAAAPRRSKAKAKSAPAADANGDDDRSRRRRRRRRPRRSDEAGENHAASVSAETAAEVVAEAPTEPAGDEPHAANDEERDGDGAARRRRRGRRGGRWRGRREDGAEPGADAVLTVSVAAGAAAIGAAAIGATAGEFVATEDMPYRVAEPEVAEPATHWHEDVSTEPASAVAHAVDESIPTGIAELPEVAEPAARWHEDVSAEPASAVVHAVEGPPPARIREPEPAVAAEEEAPSAEAEQGVPYVSEQERVLETQGVATASLEPADAARPSPSVPPGADVHEVGDKPANPRRGWWQRLIES